MTPIPTLTEDEIRYYFHNDNECIKRSFKQCDVHNPFVRPSESTEMPEVKNKNLIKKKRFKMIFLIEFKLFIINA